MKMEQCMKGVMLQKQGRRCVNVMCQGNAMHEDIIVWLGFLCRQVQDSSLPLVLCKPDPDEHTPYDQGLITKTCY